MTLPQPASTNPGNGDDDQPYFPPNLFQDSTWSLKDLHHLQEIGKGKDTIIYSATCPRLGGRLAAVKVYDKAKVAPTKLRAIKREIAMMIFFQKKKVPNIVEFYAAFQDDNYYYIVMEYCPGGDLLEFLLRDRKAMSERRCAADVARPLLTTIARLHELNVIHRDIKLENIFLDGAGRVKLGDFGLTMSMRQEAAISPVGTVEYMAPEVIALPPVDMVTSGKVRSSSIPPTNAKVDIWALGVTFYELVTGRLPFEGKDKAEIKAAITQYNLAPFPLYVSPPCQNMIRSMLAYSATDRPSAVELLKYPYMQLYSSGNDGVGAGTTVTLEVRAGPPGSPPYSDGSIENGRSRAANSYINAYETYSSSPTGGRIQFPGAPMNASSREVSASNLGGGRTSSQKHISAIHAAARAGSSAWAALKRMSAGYNNNTKTSGEQEQQLLQDTEQNEGKGGVKGAVKRLFSRQSAPHRVQSGSSPGAATVSMPAAAH